MLALILMILSNSANADMELPRAKEKIVSWLVTPDDQRIAKESNAHRNELKACGYDVVEVNGGSPSSLASRLQNEKLPEGSLLLVDSHGLAYSDGKFVFTKTRAVTSFRSGKVGLPEQDEPAKPVPTFSDITLFEGEELAKALSTTKQKPRIWLDVCHAGFCPIPAGCKVGTVCTFGSASSEVVDVTQMLVDLMCSRKTDCAVWRQFDKNGDGYIKPEEFDAELKARAGHSSDTNLMNSIVPTPSEARASFEQKCQALGGSTEAQTVGYPFEVQYHYLDEHGFGVTAKMSLNSARIPEIGRRGGGGVASVTAIVIPNQPPLKTEYEKDYFATDIAEARRVAKKKGFDALDVKQLSEKQYVKLTCVKALAEFTIHDYKQTPNLTQFDLEAPNCAIADGKSSGTNPAEGVIHIKPRP